MLTAQHSLLYATAVMSCRRGGAIASACHPLHVIIKNLYHFWEGGSLLRILVPHLLYHALQCLDHIDTASGI